MNVSTLLKTRYLFLSANEGNLALSEVLKDVMGLKVYPKTLEALKSLKLAHTEIDLINTLYDLHRGSELPVKH